ncbi:MULTISPECIES: hypothetical protein [Leptolyngbya]|jgi:hypothetical protein|uniref:Uncharacterized protein n=2 Tax=Leptolyngbya boryana TaxID=1184 RepID=A0A1Z4JQ40_LEPBY|nr:MULTISPECIES: hypothetical protein [Leptolyngbya]BAY58834.1 hypothetical protein NIES2135_57080 [Leptolyngbya boryana NIES-2135]MBN8559191.1 hypothetical protein [Leptolyngbya sp. UWPOB_LEPTO1]MCY6489186.1 hypothetical protein [Leptolyngbya sp. GGD]ULP29888.1 hypothetical protein MCP04_28315 [Leptolyngbya boryana IU 594]WNZ48191.1 hypothetical protein Q2T42_10145 [Leptolyngbya boryana CZ1]
MNQVMKQPSSWLFDGIKLNPSDRFRPFYFTDELQARLEFLLEGRKQRTLSEEEEAEMMGLLELNRIFSFVNTKLASELWQSTTSLDNLSGDEPNSSANIATP